MGEDRLPKQVIVWYPIGREKAGENLLE
jgi:hypothetical protein